LTLAEQIKSVAALVRAETTDEPTLQWSEAEPPIVISTSLELDRALHDIVIHKSSMHAIVAVVFSQGHQVGIGLGLPVSFVSFRSCDPAQEQPCVITVAESPPEQGAMFYFLNSQRTEIQRQNLIPATLARQIVREFLKTGRRPTTTRWAPL
jgi:hypothetical protein